MLAKKPSEPLMVDPLAGTLLKLRQDPAVAVVGAPLEMLADNLANVVHKLLLFFGGLIRAVLSVVVGALRQIDRLQTSAQVRVLLCADLRDGPFQTRTALAQKILQEGDFDFLLDGPCRSSLAIFSFFSFSLPKPPKTLEPFSFNFDFQPESVTG